MEKYLILSLDITDINHAEKLVNNLKDHIALVKIGHFAISSFTRLQINDICQNIPVLLDLKFYDIPNTIVSAVDSYTHNLHNLQYFTFNGNLDKNTITTLAKKYPEAATAVLVLSSEKCNVNNFINKAKINYELGIRNFICPPAYIKAMRENFLDHIKLFTPGIRSNKHTSNDHSFSSTAKEALSLGTNYVIVGRPFINSNDLKATVQEYI